MSPVCTARITCSDSPPPSREALGHLVTERGYALRLGPEEGLGGFGPPGGQPASQAATSSTPAPVRALVSAVRTPGLTESTLARKRSRSKSMCGRRSILLTTTSSQVRNMRGYLSGLSSPSVTEQTIALASSPT